MLDGLTIRLHYSRRGWVVSPRGKGFMSARRVIPAAIALLAALPVCAQYPGQITKPDKDQPTLRAVGVLEWTGDPGKPKMSRLVPLTVFDGEQLQDGGVYLARPQPLAVAGGVEYILQKDGARIGLFDIEGSGQEQGSWVGFGAWKPMPSPKPNHAEMAQAKVDEEESDRPTLHRKANSGGSSGGDAGPDSGKSAPDPDRPTLHKKSSGDDSDSSSTSSAPASDPDRPTLHKTSSGDDTDSSSSSTSSASDPDRPTLKKSKEKKTADAGFVESLPDVTDPDRPRLLRGKSTGGGADVTPTLMGLPPDMEQAVAVSDPKNTPPHPWGYSWADPADEMKMKSALEDIARDALGIKPPPPPPAPKTKAAKAKAKTKLTEPAVPPPLSDEVFRVFELAYGSGATMVLTAHTDGPPTQQKYVTLIAQPDLYGSLLVLFKSVTDGAHLDDTPRMRLVDAVDALADNRGELVFELRGTTQRQFALYRVLRGTAEKLFVTGGGPISSNAGD